MAQSTGKRTRSHLGDIPVTSSAQTATVAEPASVVIRSYEPEDAAALVEVFRASVHRIASKDYTGAQIRAWAPDELDERSFATRWAGKSVWVAQVSNRIAGFGDFERDGHIDMLYVHPDFKRRGVARGLLEHIETSARGLELRRLYVEASITARPLFESLGFRVVVAQTIALRGESLRNYRMEKRLTLPALTMPGATS